jgi:8-oxo-dGTP pyrophosphatase MutT (NUDIX family)
MSDAIVAVIQRGERFLVIRRAPGVILPGYWAPLSGRVEPDESQPAAVVREVLEEVGLRVEAVEKVWECPTDDGDFALHWWTVRCDPGDVVLDPQEVSEARWVTPEEFLDLTPTFEGDRRFFQHVLPRLRKGDSQT